MGGILLIALLIPLLAVVLDSPPARALATRLERGTSREGEAPEGDRLAALEGEVQRLSEQLEELEQESRFLRRLLEERPKRPGLGPGNEAEGA